jgi:hypothetical protein
MEYIDPEDKAELLVFIERDWALIQTFLSGLSLQQLTQIKNSDGWTIKDHVAHLSAWHRGIVAFLKGIPRYHGLGIPEEVYASHDVDAMNAIIFEAHRDELWEDVRAEFQRSRDEILSLVMPLSDEELQKPYHHFVPAEPEDTREAIIAIYVNTAEHYIEHLEWMQAMLAE